MSVHPEVKCYNYSNANQLWLADNRKHNMKIEKNISFNPKEGIYLARILSAEIKTKEHKGRQVDYLRIIYVLDSSKSAHEFRAGKSYYESQYAQIRTDLDIILGAEAADLFDEDNHLLSERLEMLLGKRVTLRIKHVDTGQPKPFCEVELVPPHDRSRDFLKN